MKEKIHEKDNGRYTYAYTCKRSRLRNNECMKNEKVHFVSHPDDDHTSLDYEMLVKAAKQYQVALEVNNSSLVKKEQRLNNAVAVREIPGTGYCQFRRT